jgi:hypothetical protein
MGGNYISFEINPNFLKLANEWIKYSEYNKN